ncbi:MAG: phosphoglucosamine mutase [Opitutaceae bacterium]|nr:phosphoglucosamine mutase [Opitutaceae bacterium]
MSRKYFGTDGVRGPYGGPVINEGFAARLGFAAARWVGRPGRVVVGRDTRASGSALEAAVMRGLRAAGADPVSLGVLPTPAVARAVRMEGAVLGVVITASHNPADDNGIKFFGPGGVKLTDADELAIEQQLPADIPGTAPSGAVEPAAANAAEPYIAAARQLLPTQALRGWRIVLDTANGATCGTTPVVLRALGAEVVGLGDAPDGRNINAGVGSEHPAPLAARVLAEQARIGIAHDGDGDRCVLCDERGVVLDGDEILTILATHALAQRRLVRDTLVITVQSNLGVDAAITAAGGRVVRTNVGDRYVVAGMLAAGATLGGESSGHIICSEISPTGDGLVAALRVIQVMLETRRPLSELRQSLRKFPQITAALPVREKKPLETLPRLGAAIRSLEAELGTRGRVLVRYSGTEAKLRFLVEGPTDEIVTAGLNRLKAAAGADGLF